MSKPVRRAGFFSILFSGALAFIDWAARADFAASHLRWLRETALSAIGWLPYPSLLWFPTMVLGFVLIGWDARRSGGGHAAKLSFSGRLLWKREATSKREWRKPADAIDTFCDPGVVARKNKLLIDFENTLAKRLEIDAENDRRRARMPTNFQADPEYQPRSKIREAYIIAERVMEDEIRAVWKELREDIGRNLENSHLNATGILEPYKGGSGEDNIKSVEWRVLTLNPVDETAVKKKDGTVIYSGVLIARATKN